MDSKYFVQLRCIIDEMGHPTLEELEEMEFEYTELYHAIKVLDKKLEEVGY